MCTIRIYIFHEFVLEHALGNRINVYCPSQSCRHQTSKWRNWASAKKQRQAMLQLGSKTGRKKVTTTTMTTTTRENTELSTRPIMSIHKSWFQQDRKCYCECMCECIWVCVCVQFIFFHSLFSWFVPFCSVFRIENEPCSGRSHRRFEQKHLILNCWSFLFSVCISWHLPSTNRWGQCF